MMLMGYFEKFVEALHLQLQSDQARWGDTWKYRPRGGQVKRIMARFHDYEDQFHNGGTPMPWLKVVGEAFIGWVRDNYPDYATREEL